MRLYEINEQLERLLMLDDANAVDQETGEVFSADQIEALEMAKEEKIEGSLLFVKNMNAEADMLKAEIDKLTARMKACKNKAERCKEYIAGVLNGDKFKTARVSVSYRNAESVELQGELIDVPHRFLRVKPAELDKVAVKAALKAGETVPGCVLVTKTSMSIK